MTSISLSEFVTTFGEIYDCNVKEARKKKIKKKKKKKKKKNRFSVQLTFGLWKALRNIFIENRNCTNMLRR